MLITRVKCIESLYAVCQQGRRRTLKNNKDKILIVVDDQAVSWTLSEALRSWSLRAIEAATISEGVAQFNAETPAAVLLDIDLPDGSGLDLLRRIKDERPDVVVIMITGKEHEGAGYCSSRCAWPVQTTQFHQTPA